MHYYKQGRLQRKLLKQAKRDVYDKYEGVADLEKCQQLEKDLCEVEGRVTEELRGVPTLPHEKLRVLDVGSCYNPMQNIESLQTLAVDLCPAAEVNIVCKFRLFLC